MTLAQLYQHLLTTQYFGLRRDPQIEMIHTGQRITAKLSKADAERYYKCMQFDPEILLAANHTFALELSLANSVGQQGKKRTAAWIAGKLLQGYVRDRTIREIELAMVRICANINLYDHLSLNDAIHNWRAIDAPAQPAPPAAAALNGAAPPHVPAEAQRLIAPALPEALQGASKDIKDSFLHAQANNCLYLVIRGEDGKREKFFIPKNRFDAFRAFFTTPIDLETDREENICSICMSNKGDHSCGRENCSALFCSTCFHSWFSKNDKCTNCQREYIPITARPGVPPVRHQLDTRGEAENEDDGED